MNEIKLDSLEAYRAMYSFLEYEYDLTGSDDIAALLGSMSVLEDGSTADPHMMILWQEILNKIPISQSSDISLKLK